MCVKVSKIEKNVKCGKLNVKTEYTIREYFSMQVATGVKISHMAFCLCTTEMEARWRVFTAHR